MFGYEFADPIYLFLLLLIVPIVLWYIFKERTSHADLQYSSLKLFSGLKQKNRLWLRHVLFAIKMIALAILVLALARPQSENRWESYTSEGIDIVLSLDISPSMLAMDFDPNRLEAAKDVASKFILERPQDKIGLVVFSGESFTQCPLTTDHAVLINMIHNVKCGLLEDGTAIGLGLANAVSRLKDSKSKSKVIILLTDGVNNCGSIAPATAAELAKTYGIRVYTIGVGSKGEQRAIYQGQMVTINGEIDEEVLKEIASTTGGKYFRATNKEKLSQIYSEIDKMEKTKIETMHFSKKDEKYFLFALIGACLLVLESLLRYTLLRKIP